jgi:hypothetical protein
MDQLITHQVQYSIIRIMQVFALLQQEKVHVASEDDIFLSLDPSGATPLLDNEASLSSSNVRYVRLYIQICYY